MKYATPFYQWLTRLLRGLAILTFTALVFPLAAAVCLPCYLMAVTARTLASSTTAAVPSGKCILILAAAKGKALHLGRLFKAEGFKVVMAETEAYYLAGASFSSSVDEFFYLPDPAKNPDGYVSTVVKIVEDHDVSLFVPLDPRTVEEDLQVLARLPESCRPLTCDAEGFRELDNKSTFMAALDRCGIRAPGTRQVSSEQEAYVALKGKSRHYVFKPILYDNVARANVLPPADPAELQDYLHHSGVDPSRPYVIQERLQGPEMASVFLVINGKLISHTAGYSSPVYQTQNHVDCEGVVSWVEDFVRRYHRKLNGWFTVDFMVSPVDGRFYPLECNPRLGTCFMLYGPGDGAIPLMLKEMDRAPPKARSLRGGLSEEHKGPDVRDAKSSKASQKDYVEPRVKQIYYLMNVLWVMVSNPFNLAVLKEYGLILLRGREALFSVWDPLPFMALNFLQMPLLIVKYLLLNKTWNIVDYNIGTLKMA